MTSSTTGLFSLVFMTTLMTTELGRRTVFAKPIAGSDELLCIGSASIDLLGLTLELPDSMFRGVQILNQGNKRGYWFDSDEASTIGIGAEQVLNRCEFFPNEFSVLFSFCKGTKRRKNEFLFTLIAEDRRTIIMSMRLRRDRLFFSIRPVTGRNVTFSFRDARFIDGKWHTYSLSISSHHAQLTIDCGCNKETELKTEFPSSIQLAGSKFFVASRRSKRNRFTGLLRQLILVPGSDVINEACQKDKKAVTATIPTNLALTSATNSVRDQRVSLLNDQRMLNDQRGCRHQRSAAATFVVADESYDFRHANRTIVTSGCRANSWEGSKHEFQRLDYVSEFAGLTTTSKSLDMEIFTIHDEGTFLASANQGRDRNMNSGLYKWTGKGFSFYQDLKTTYAQDFEFFTIGEEYFLAVANYGSVRDKNVVSTIFRWTCEVGTFIPHQHISTIRARFIRTFTIGGKLFMVTANDDKRQNYKDTSCLYIWNPENRLFERYQTLHTSVAYDAEYFMIGSNHYLAIANHFKGVSTRIHSVIYRWMRSGFEPSQYIETAGATDWEYFNISGKHFLAVANSYDKGEHSDTFEVASQIYRYDESLMMFVDFQSIPTYSAYDMEFFSLGRDLFIVAASSSDKKKDLENVIYRWQGVEGFVPVHRVKTPPSSDWEKFQTSDGRHFLIAASVSSSQKESKIFQLITF